MAQAKYQEIADRLRDQIDSGTLQPGERLPSEPDLVKPFDASRNTVRLAIALLTNQGLVVTRQGLGTFVNEPSSAIHGAAVEGDHAACRTERLDGPARGQPRSTPRPRRHG